MALKKISWLLHSLGIDRGLAYVSVGNFLYTSLGALLWFFLASMMQVSEYGNLNYQISIAAVLTSIGLMGFDTTLTTFVAKGISRMIPQSSFLVLLAGIVVSLIVYIVFHSWPLVFLLLSAIFFSLASAEVLGRHMFREFMLMLVIQRILTLILVPLLFFQFGVDGAVIGFAIAHIVMAYRFFISLSKMDVSISTIVPIKKYFAHSYALGISKTLPYFSDKLLILPLYGLSMLGYYQFGVQMLTVTSIVPVILYNYLLPKVAGGGKESTIKTIWLGIGSSLIITVLLIVLMPYVVSHLFPNFKDAIVSSQVILLAGVPLSAIAIITSILMAEEKSVNVVISAAVFLSTQYLLIAVLGGHFGQVGLSVATVVAATIQCSYLLIASRLTR